MQNNHSFPVRIKFKFSKLRQKSDVEQVRHLLFTTFSQNPSLTALNQTLRLYLKVQTGYLDMVKGWKYNHFACEPKF